MPDMSTQVNTWMGERLSINLMLLSAVTLSAAITNGGIIILSVEDCTVKTLLGGASIENVLLCGSIWLSSAYHLHPTILSDIADNRAEW